MPRFENTKILPYSDKQLYSIIINVEKYSEFLPWCKDSQISNRIDENNFDAKLIIGYKALDENYTSRVKGVYLKEITSNAIAGPFKHLDSLWTFKKAGIKCEVKFSLDYEFKSFLLGKVMGSLFHKASEKMFEAFEERAKSLYSN